MFPPACSFVIGKEKQAIFANRTSHGHAEDVADQFIRHIWLVVGCLGILDEKIVGAGNRVAHVIVSCAMEVVRAAFGHQRDLRSRSLALIGVVVRRGHSEFLHGIHRNRKNGCKRISVGLVIHVHAVESCVALVAPRSVDRAIPCVVVLHHGVLQIRTVPRVNNAGLQAEQVRHIAALERNLFHLRFVERVSE